VNGWVQLGVGLAAFVALVAASGFFSGLAAVLIAINRFRLRHGEEHQGDKRVQRVVALFEDAQRVLGVSLVGSTLANVAAIVALAVVLQWTLGAPERPFDWSIAAIALLAGVPILLIFGEVVPRRLFRARANRAIFWLYGPIRWSLLALGPLARVGIWLAQCATRAFGVPDLPPAALPRSESWESLDEVERGDLLEPVGPETSERRMIHGIFDLQETRVREVMRPLVDLVAVRLPERVDAVRALARRTGYSRFPVYPDRITNLSGYIDIYDILASDPPDSSLVDQYRREAFYVPETKRLDDLLQELLQRHHKVAIVVDEYGGCSGWVTREDLIEEIVGEIEDEFDQASEPIRRVDEGTYLVSAAIDLDDLNEQIGLRLASREFDTLGGFIHNALGRIPQVGDSFDEDGVRYDVAEMDGRRIVTIRIARQPFDSSSSKTE
jgi:putative hemolysin